MEKESNTTKVGFLEAYNQLPAGIQGMVRNRIRKECEWEAHTTFYAKVNGTSPIKLPEWRVLREIFAEYGIDVFTGQTLKTA